VAVQVAHEEDRLEEEQDRRPDRRRPSEDGQHQTADQRLDAEQQNADGPIGSADVSVVTAIKREASRVRAVIRPLVGVVSLVVGRRP
jgi:hypothetical protein